MSGKIIVNTERCKGCSLCVGVCPKQCITISTISNKNGFFPARQNKNSCTACAACAIICPEAAIEVIRDTNIIEIKVDSKKKSKTLVEEKT